MNQKNELIFTRKTSGLVKGLNWYDIFVLVISAPAGSGILYYSVSTASTYPGGNVGLSFLIGFILILPIIFLAAFSSDLIPSSGSLYVFISRLISPGVGYIAAALFFLGYTLSIGVVAYVVTQVIGGILITSGLASHNTTIQDLGELLQKPLYSTIGGTVLVLLTWIIVLRGIQLFKKVMRYLFLITILAVIITISYFFFTSHSGIIDSFNSIWGANSYQDILNLSQQKGWTTPGFSWDSTVNLLLVVLFSYAGLELISYSSGEVSKEPKKNMRSYIYATISLAAIYTILAFSVSFAYGDFIGAYDFLVKNHAEDLKNIMPVINPSIPFFISSIISQSWWGITISLGLSLWFVTTMIPYFFAPSRLIFALAMDRAIPESMADVNSKTGAPTNASHLTLLFALLGVFFNLLNVGTVLGTILFSAVFVYWLYGLSAILLPYKNPELYERAFFQKTFLGLPVITIVGAITFGIGWFVIFFSASQMSMDIVITLCIYMILAFILYIIKLQKNREQGIDLNSVYSQLPPE